MVPEAAYADLPFATGEAVHLSWLPAQAHALPA